MGMGGAEAPRSGGGENVWPMSSGPGLGKAWRSPDGGGGRLIEGDKVWARAGGGGGGLEAAAASGPACRTDKRKRINRTDRQPQQTDNTDLLIDPLFQICIVIEGTLFSELGLDGRRLDGFLGSIRFLTSPQAS